MMQTSYFTKKFIDEKWREKFKDVNFGSLTSSELSSIFSVTFLKLFTNYSVNFRCNNKGIVYRANQGWIGIQKWLKYEKWKF